MYLCEIFFIEAKRLLLNIILIRKNLICTNFQHTIYSHFRASNTRVSAETPLYERHKGDRFQDQGRRAVRYNPQKSITEIRPFQRKGIPRQRLPGVSDWREGILPQYRRYIRVSMSCLPSVCQYKYAGETSRSAYTRR